MLTLLSADTKKYYSTNLPDYLQKFRTKYGKLQFVQLDLAWWSCATIFEA